MKKLIILLLFVPFILGVSQPVESEPELYPVPLDAELQAHIISVSDAYNVDPVLVMAIIEKESQYDANAIGDNCNSFGLMQVNAQYHGERMAKLGVTNLLCPYCNVLVGIDYFAELLEEYGDVHKALVAYNAGPTRANEVWFSKGIYTNEYSREVINFMNETFFNGEIGGFTLE